MNKHIIENDTVIFLTACIDPQGMYKTVLTDAKLRLSQYKAALEYYLSNTTIKIIFVDNSGYDFSIEYEHAIRSGRLEYLTFDGNRYERKRGKGYGEASIIQYALNNSLFLSTHNYIIKITGRLIIKNITHIIEEFSQKSKITGNLIMCDINLKLNIAETRLFICNKCFLNTFFLPNVEMINDENGVYFEHAIALAIKTYIQHKHKHAMFSEPINIYGISGTTGYNYKTISQIDLIKRKIKLLLYHLSQWTLQ